MKNHHRGILCFSLLLIFCAGLFLPGGNCEASEPFPLYPCIRPNVNFWKKVYSKYGTTHGIIHDSRNLGVIYEVIDLKKRGARNARRVNKKRIEKAKKKYAGILRLLASNPSHSKRDARRVAALFGAGATRKTYQRAIKNIRCQVGQRDRFRKGLIRSGAYLGEIKRIFVSQGLPVDLAYLPHVESSFNPKAYSKFGAAGIWQFTRSTGKRFMSVNYTLDERWDPLQASRAAARLLKSNYGKLRNWPFALTAYNHGVAGMMRAKKAKGSYPAVFKGYRGRSFKFASRNFYSEFLAAREVARNWERYFGKLKFHKPVRTRKIRMEGYASVGDLSRFFKVSTPTIRRLNPTLRAPVFRGQKDVPKGYVLKLPASAGKGQSVTSLSRSSNIYRSHQKRSRFYRVQKGDTAGKIAKIHGVRLSDLIRANNLNAGACIFAGQNLRIPGRGEKISRPVVARKTVKKKSKAVRRNLHKPALVSGRPSESKPAVKSRPEKAAITIVSERREFPVNPSIVTGKLSVERVAIRKGQPVGVIRVGAEETLGHYADWLAISTHKIRRLNGFR